MTRDCFRFHYLIDYNNNNRETKEEMAHRIKNVDDKIHQSSMR